MEIVFRVNKVQCKIKPEDIAPDTSLNVYLRTRLCLTGTKFKCQEGGCGCCIVNISGLHPVSGEQFSLAVNSCLFLVFSCHGLDITTIEGIGNKKKGYHPLQERLAHHDGTQCGFCSPGFIMNMYSLYEGKFGLVTEEEIEDSFGGNMCRCTGYRPILDAFKTFATAPQQMTSICEDIEELSLTKCPKRGSTCTKRCSGSVHIKAADNAEWHKVTVLSEILQILSNIGPRKYRLVAGNTATGIYRMPYDIEVFIDVSTVRELRTYSIEETVEVGGNVTIAEWMRILLEAADKLVEFTYCRQVRDHLSQTSTVPVRNVGTIAGNLMIKHEHREFYSDVFLLLEAVNGSIIFRDKSGNQQNVSPQDFLKVDMNKKVITKISMPQLSPSLYHFRSYKIKDRAQNAISYMNAGFLFEIYPSSQIVKTPRIVYGGINPNFIHANSIEKFLAGKDLFKNKSIQAIVNIIDSDFHFDDSLPNSSAAFRRILAIGLFYKTILSLAPSERLNPYYKSGATLIHRPLSSGRQSYETIPEKYPLTQPIMKTDALVLCSGEAEFVNDVHVHDALWAAFVLANDPLKIISSIDVSAALAVKGVKAFYGAKDIPGVNSFIPTSKLDPRSYSESEEVFCSGKVLFHGQPVGVIVAEEMSQAVYAADLVKIIYAQDVNKDDSFVGSVYRYFKGDMLNVEEKFLPTLTDILEAEPHITEHRYDIPTVIIAASHINVDADSKNIKGNLLFGPQYHYPIESNQTVVVPVEDGMDVFPATQWIDLTNTAIASVLSVDNNTIHIKVRRNGGAFGIKISRATQIATAAAIACYHQQRPIRMILPMQNEMRAIGKRTPSFYEYDVDFSNLGAIQRLNCDITIDLGCSKNELPSAYGSLFDSSAYTTPTWTVVFHSVLTDAPSNTWMRAPIATPTIAFAETVMEHIAWILKRDPIDVRLANIAPDNPMKKVLADFLVNCDYYNRLNEVKEFNRKNRWKKRGIAICLMQYPQPNPQNYEALVVIYHGDGTVALNVSAIDIGQGMYTKLIQIAASILGVPFEKVKITPANNLISANAMDTSGNWTTDSIANAVIKCCEILNARLKPFKLANPTGSWQDIIQEAYTANIELIALAQHVMGTIPFYSVYGCSCAEIEIDVLTGNFQLNRVDIVEDVGQSINPRLDVGQIEGAFIMGLGYWLHEKLVYNRSNGELLTNRAWNYKIPGAKDIPVDFRVTLLQTNTHPTGILGSKTCSECAVSMAVVAIFALRRALESARKDAGAPDIFLQLDPSTTVETILQLAGTKNEQFIL